MKEAPRSGQWGVAAALVVLGVLGTLYFALVPGRAARTYRDDARPALARDRGAMEGVYASFTPAAFAFSARDERGISSARSPATYLRAIRRAVRRQRRLLRRPRRSIDHARGALDAGHHALADLSEPPLLGGRGQLADARSVRADAGEYEDQASALLNSYAGLLDYQERSLGLSLAFAHAYARGLVRAARSRSDPVAAARALDSAALDVARVVARLRELDPPGPLEPSRRAGVGAARFVALQLHGAAVGLRAGDAARVSAANRALQSGSRRLAAGSPGALRALIEGSSVRLRIDRTRRLARGVERGLASL